MPFVLPSWFVLGSGSCFVFRAPPRWPSSPTPTCSCRCAPDQLRPSGPFPKHRQSSSSSTQRRSTATAASSTRTASNSLYNIPPVSTERSKHRRAPLRPVEALDGHPPALGHLRTASRLPNRRGSSSFSGVGCWSSIFTVAL